MINSKLVRMEGSAGIININLVRNKEEGFIGNLTLSVGYGKQPNIKKRNKRDSGS